MFFLSTADTASCNSMDMSSVRPIYQTDKLYTVQLESAGEV